MIVNRVVLSMISRRSFLKQTSAVPIAAGLTIFPPFSRPAQAVEPATIAAVVTIASTLISMFTKSNEMARQLAILNAKLDTIISLQKLTIKSLEIISSQIEVLSKGLDQALINQTIREDLGKVRGLLSGLNQITERVQSSGSLTDSYLTELNEKLLEAECDRAVAICNDFQGNLESSPADGDRGLDTARFATVAAYVGHVIVPTFTLLDSELDTRGIAPVSRTARYETIIGALKSACDTFVAKHGPSQVSHQKKVLGSLLGSDGTYKQWAKEVNFPQKASFKFTERFMNFQAYGPCTHGNNFNDDKTAQTFLIFGGDWSNYRFEVDKEISGTGAVVDGKWYGVQSVSWKTTRKDRIHIGNFKPNQAGWQRQNKFSGNPILPMRFKQYYCPGMPGHDRPNHSLTNLNSYYEPDLNKKLSAFTSVLYQQTERRLNVLGLEESIAWCSQAAGILEESSDVLASAK